MKEIVVLSGKGGTGKTSIAASFGVLARNAVLVDCDVDAADLHLLFPPQIQETNEFSGGKVASIDPDLCLSCSICAKLCRFDAISQASGVYVVDALQCEGCGVCAYHCPANAIEMREAINGHWYISKTRIGPMVHARLGIAEENSGKLVAVIKSKARELALQSNAQFLIVDGPPGIGCPVIASLSGADRVVAVTEPSVSGIHDLKRVIELASHFRIPVSIVINKYDINEEKAHEIEVLAKDTSSDVIAHIPYDRKITEAQIAQKTIVEFDNGRATDAIRDAWQKVSGPEKTLKVVKA